MKSERHQIKTLEVFLIVLVSLCIILSSFLIFSIGKHIYTAKEREAEERRQREIQESNMQSLIGKRVISISGLEKPIVIAFEGGGEIKVDCYKYPIHVNYTPSVEVSHETNHVR